MCIIRQIGCGFCGQGVMRQCKSVCWTIVLPWERSILNISVMNFILTSLRCDAITLVVAKLTLKQITHLLEEHRRIVVMSRYVWLGFVSDRACADVEGYYSKTKEEGTNWSLLIQERLLFSWLWARRDATEIFTDSTISSTIHVR